MIIEEYIPLSKLTTLRVGGPARYLVTVESESDLLDAVLFAEGVGLPIIPLGAGSNMLGRDEGVNAVFIKVALKGIRTSVHADTVLVTTEAGTAWDSVVEFAVENGWWGIENLSSIPGTVGGAVVQNIGAYGAVLSDVLTSVDVFDCREKRMHTLSAPECAFGYRTSIFKVHQDRHIVVRATLALSQAPRRNISYKDLTHWFQGVVAPAVEEIRHAVTTVRAQKFPSLTEYGTAGSFFLNPVMSPENASLLQSRYPAIPLFPLPEGGVKVPLAWFFEHVVKAKGMRSEGAHVWHAHALVIATDEGTTAADIYKLAEEISSEVFDTLGIKIFPEVRLL